MRRLAPRSLFGRLLLIAAITTLAALAFAAVTIGQVLERFVIHGLDQQLDAQIATLARAVRPDGTLDQARVVSLPEFDDPESGWGWRVDGPGGRAWSRGSAIDASGLLAVPRRLEGRDHQPGRDEIRADMEEPRPGDTRGLSGEPVHFRQLVVQSTGGPVLVTAAGPRRVALRPLREAMVPLLGSLALLGLGLAFATLLQLRIGLRPLRALSAALAEVRAGRVRHVPLDQPSELAPLAAELNALIDQNEAGLAHARRHVSNLAHGLKTPLAALGVKLAESNLDADGSLATLVGQIDGRIRHHLGRARAGAPGAAQRSRTMLSPAFTDLGEALGRIHAERAIAVSAEIEPDLAVSVDPQDLDEMMGNLLDNAWRHARSRIVVTAERVEGTIIVTIDDNGPGLAEGALREALMPGRRLDEQGDGHGFGLSIADELATLCGGKLTLLNSPVLGGLRATLTLPASN